MCEMEKCTYCDAGEQTFLLGDDSFGSNEVVRLDLTTKTIEVEIWVGAFTSNPECAAISMYVNYCPVCGRNLHE